MAATATPAPQGMTKIQSAAFWINAVNGVCYSVFIFAVLYTDDEIKFLRPIFHAKNEVGGMIASATTSAALAFCMKISFVYALIDYICTKNGPRLRDLERWELAVHVATFVAPVAMVVFGVLIRHGDWWWYEFKWGILWIVMITSLHDFLPTYRSFRVLFGLSED